MGVGVSQPFPPTTNQSSQKNEQRVLETMGKSNKMSSYEMSEGRIFSPNSPENHAGI